MYYSDEGSLWLWERRRGDLYKLSNAHAVPKEQKVDDNKYPPSFL